MTVSLGQNISALKAIRQLDLSSKRVEKGFARLSSGLRINSASDDAAGLSVSETLNYKTRILNRAKANIEDGISALEITSGSANSISSLLTRLSEIAEQGATGTFSSSQRKALDKEFQELDKEIRRIASTTEFNGLRLGVGSKSSAGASTLTTSGQSVNTRYDVTGDGRYITYANATSGTIEQLDTETNTRSILVSGATGVGFTAANSANGEVVAFSTSANINGLNPGAQDAVYMYNRSTQTLSVIAATTTSDRTRGLVISADGSKIAFRHDTKFNSDGSVNTNASVDVHVYDVATDNLTRTGYTLSQNTSISISADGSYVAYADNRDPLGTNSELLIEVFTFQTNNIGGTLRQISNGSSGGVNGLGGIDNYGNVAYISTSNLTGENSSNLYQVFYYNNQQNSNRQLTNNTSANQFTSLKFSNDGSSIFFRTNANLTNENSTSAYQIYAFDLQSNQLSQRTKYTDGTLNTGAGQTISGDGNSFYYVSTEIKIADISPGALSLGIETGNGQSGEIASLLKAFNGVLRGLGNHGVTSQAAARGALDAIKLNIEKLGSYQGTLGASLNRLQVGSSLASAQSEEFSAARSRIANADIAEESANLVRYSLLQQASTAVLAQANIEPQIALQLLNI